LRDAVGMQMKCASMDRETSPTQQKYKTIATNLLGFFTFFGSCMKFISSYLIVAAKHL